MKKKRMFCYHEIIEDDHRTKIGKLKKFIKRWNTYSTHTIKEINESYEEYKKNGR